MSKLFDKESVLELLKNTGIMLAIAICAGAVLGVVYEITKEPIATMELKAKEEACKNVFVNASSFSENIVDAAKVSEVLSEKYSGVDITQALKAFDNDGNVLGYVMEVTSHEGYGGDIVFMVGLQPDGTTNGISITSISETAGLGMRADEVIRPQFVERNAIEFEVTKTGAVYDNQIDAISSATITSKAIVNGVNAALLYERECLSGGDGNE